MSARPNLKVVDTDTGEVSDCASCALLQDQVAELESELRGRRALIAQLKRDKEAWAYEHEDWQVTEQLFAEWKVATGHTRSPFTVTRFELALPYVRNPKYGVEMIRLAIRGLAYDPHTRVSRNGRVEAFNWWENLFKNGATFERYANRAPRVAA